MPSLVFIEKDFLFVPFFVESGDVFSVIASEPWKLNKVDLLKLSRTDLLQLVPRRHDVKKRHTKEEITELLTEVWTEVVDEKNRVGVSKGRSDKSSGSGDRGFSGGGDDRDDQDNDQGGFQPVPLPPDDSDNDMFSLTVQKCWSPPTFKSFVVAPNYSLMVKVLLTNEWGVAVRSLRLQKAGFDLLDDALLIESDIDNSVVLQAVVRGFGGGKPKRARADEDENPAGASPKELRQLVCEGVVQLRSMQNIAPAVQETLTKIDSIMEQARNDPEHNVSSLFPSVPVEKMSLIVSTTLTVSRRPTERVAFIGEHLLSPVFEGLDALNRQEALARRALIFAIQYSIHCEYTDQNGGIAWQRFIKEVASAMTRRAVAPPPDDNRCVIV